MAMDKGGRRWPCMGCQRRQSGNDGRVGG
ncbi:uncharacterized protein G2W53_010998 [Senna tora]|uniref:Uncharacterized protein n=1 Tax=Senna tora TaxID=362788 RepID=A0A834X137_9FABA|nr:uncharacterized protein G2W53_010998 [Senna tora]